MNAVIDIRGPKNIWAESSYVGFGGNFSWEYPVFGKWSFTKCLQLQSGFGKRKTCTCMAVYDMYLHDESCESMLIL